MLHSEYIAAAVCPTSHPIVIRNAVKALRKPCFRKLFDGIAFRGMSGALVAPEIAVKLKVGMLAVRKAAEHSHSELKVEGDYSCTRYVVVDDMVATGDTIRAIMEDIEKAFPSRGYVPPTLAGIILYNNRSEYVEYGKGSVTPYYLYNLFKNLSKNEDFFLIELERLRVEHKY